MHSSSQIQFSLTHSWLPLLLASGNQGPPHVTTPAERHPWDMARQAALRVVEDIKGDDTTVWLATRSLNCSSDIPAVARPASIHSDPRQAGSVAAERQPIGCGTERGACRTAHS